MDREEGLRLLTNTSKVFEGKEDFLYVTDVYDASKILYGKDDKSVDSNTVMAQVDFVYKSEYYILQYNAGRQATKLIMANENGTVDSTVNIEDFKDIIDTIQKDGK